MKENHKLSVAAIVTSMVIFGTIGIFRRYIPLPSEVLAFARGVMGSVFLLIVLKVPLRRKQNPSKVFLASIPVCL